MSSTRADSRPTRLYSAMAAWYSRWRVACARRWGGNSLRPLVAETHPGLAAVMALYVLADGVLPILALVALGRAVGRIPTAVTHGLGSPSGHALLTALAVGTGAYTFSLLRKMLAARANLVRQATPDLRHAWYYLGCS